MHSKQIDKFKQFSDFNSKGKYTILTLFGFEENIYELLSSAEVPKAAIMWAQFY